jgi:hypothetical protein
MRAPVACPLVRGRAIGCRRRCPGTPIRSHTESRGAGPEADPSPKVPKEAYGPVIRPSTTGPTGDFTVT